ncbi:hypothetical protein F4780DRAFT_412005 [Xylariomycetidae sp. FL0641]|nr:hypothetical protein F4780DRAFT_412005 [Xylariomycetidae sp. FL0641]
MDICFVRCKCCQAKGQKRHHSKNNHIQKCQAKKSPAAVDNNDNANDNMASPSGPKSAKSSSPCTCASCSPNRQQHHHHQHHHRQQQHHALVLDPGTPTPVQVSSPAPPLLHGNSNNKHGPSKPNHHKQRAAGRKPPTPTPTATPTIHPLPSTTGGMRQHYIHPWSTPHVSLPVVDHSTAHRNRYPRAHPGLYVAVAPAAAASVADVAAGLAGPEGAAVVVVARFEDGATAPLLLPGEGGESSRFASVRALEEECLQLEVWDAEEEEEQEEEAAAD